MRLEARFVFRCCRIRRIPVGRRLSRLSYGRNRPHGSNRRNRRNWSHGRDWSYGSRPHGRNGCCKLREGERGIGKNIEQILQKYVDTPTMRKEYEIEGEGVIVTRHFTAQERLNELIFQLAVRCTDEERDEGTGRTKCDRAWEE